MNSSQNGPLPPDDLLAHASFVRGLARALVGGDHDVDDVVQETWLAALGASGSAVRKPRSWLASIARRRAARLHRTRASLDKRHAEAAPAGEVQPPDERAARREIIQRVSVAVASLPAHYQDALVLRYYEALPPREVARRLEVPVETARTRIRRGLERLREILDEEHDGGRAAWALPLAGLLGSGVSAAGLGTLAVGGLALAALLVFGFVLVPPLLSKEAATDARGPTTSSAQAPAPTLQGDGDATDDAPVLKGARPVGPGMPATEPDQPSLDELHEPEPNKHTPKRRAVTVRAEDSQGQPVGGIEIVERFTKEGGGLSYRPLGRTAGDGSLTLDLPPGKAIVRVGKHERWHCNDVIVVPARDVPDREALTFRLVELVTIPGRVLKIDGTPSVGSRIQAFYRDRSSVQGVPAQGHAQGGPTGPDGRFTLRLPPYVTEVLLSVFIQGGGLVNKTFEIRGEAEIVVQPRMPTAIRGTVEGPDGKPVEGCEVTAIPVGQGEVDRVAGHEDRFSIFVSVPGRYLLVIDPQAPGLGRPDPMEVEAPIEGVRVVCPVGLSLSGKLQGEDAAKFRVFWTRHRGDERRLRVEQEEKSEQDGAFTLGGLREGETMLYAFREGDERYGLLEGVSLPAKDLQVRLRSGLAIKGRVSGYTGRHGIDLYIGASWRGPTRWGIVQEDGTFTISGLPPGRYGLRWWRGNQQEAIDREVEPGGAVLDVSVPDEALSKGQVPPK